MSGAGATRAGGDATKRYDKAYFDKWYRHPTHRVKSPTELRRQVGFVVHCAEWVLGRPIRSVLDVGCGEGNWQPVLRRLRPRVYYDGVDPSEYAVARFGRRRNLQCGSIDALDTLSLQSSYDLVVCCGMLNYLPAAVLRRGLLQVAARTGGLAYLEIFTSADAFEGDTSWPAPKAPTWYRRLMTDVGLRSVGMHGYVREEDALRVSALERLDEPHRR
ncbi:MAG: class I SAM-dependent methyltransferase [Gemmatimonadaceae bacterium]|nr:class I SAM-dependent methyltransferase [Gemmatimonadaceae bacterium]